MADTTNTSAMDEEIKAKLISYCRIEAADLTDADEADLESFYTAAVGYMEGAGVQEPDPVTDANRWERWFLCVRHMVLDAWDHRGAEETVQTHKNPAFRKMLNQLKYS